MAYRTSWTQYSIRPGSELPNCGQTRFMQKDTIRDNLQVIFRPFGLRHSLT